MPENKEESQKGLLALFLKFSVGSWFSAALSFFTTPVVTALIIPQEFGRASMFSLAYSFALQIVLLGADQSFVRKFYEKEFETNRSSLLQNCLIPALLAGLLISVCALLFWRDVSFLLVEVQDWRICLLLAATVMIGIVERYAILVVRMYQKGFLFSFLRIIGSVLTFLVIVIYANYFSRDMYAILYSILIPLTVTAVIAIAIERKLWFEKFLISKKIIQSVLHYGIPFIPTFLAYWVFEGIDKIALRVYSNYAELGLFTAAFKIVAILSILQISFSTFWAPVAYEAYEKQSEESKIVFRKTFSYLCLILFVAGLLITISKDVIMLFFDESYNGAGFIMPFLLFVPIMYTMSEITVGGINFKNRTRIHLQITLIVAGFNILLNWLLVPHYGARGAAISTGLSYILFFYCRTYFSNRLFPIDFGLPRVTVAVILFAFNAWIHSFYETALWNIMLSLLLTGIMLMLFKSEIKMLYSFIRPRLKFDK